MNQKIESKDVFEKLQVPHAFRLFFRLFYLIWDIL